MRQCTHHIQYLPGELVECKLFGINPLSHCGGCPQFQQKTRGAGDVVANALKSVGITPALISAVIGRDCGCEKRQELLNKTFPAADNT